MSKIHRTAFHQVSIRGNTSYGAVAQRTGRLHRVYEAVTSCVRGGYIVCSSIRVGSMQNARGAWHPRPGI